jgi:hypothetical protein
MDMKDREDEASVMRLILELLPGALESVEGEDLSRDAEELRAGARAGT